MSWLTDGPLPVTALLVLNALMVRGRRSQDFLTIDIEKLLAVERSTVERGKD